MVEYFHSVVLDKDKCNGCTNCMRRCPTEAIRVRNKKAIIIKDRCIDCGECIRVCPYHAQQTQLDTLDKLKKYKYKIAISPMTLYGQFSLDKDMNKVFEGIKMLGFDEVVDEGYAADIITLIIRESLKNNKQPKPLISSLCPAVLRLIQISFPSLIDNIIRIESPMELAARLARKNAMEKYNLKSEEIGIFYITQCPAKVTSIKTPIGIKNSNVDGAISIKQIYGDIVKNSNTAGKTEDFVMASAYGINWARAGGQSKSIGVDSYIVVDGIDNVIKVLEEIELGKLNNIEYFEGLACVGGCVGGPLCVENPFIAKSRIRRLSEKHNDEIKVSKEYAMELYNSGFACWTEEIQSKGTMKLDENIVEAIRKIEKIKKLTNLLPGLDCGSCGAPSCRALAEDIVRGYGKIEDCIFRD
ncbi:Iron only hydrogenase large subunit, C-terminal domain [Caloranaerobacter azorensis DSM 13643]|uniref:Iron only hydrogenase large subunit, C-terminal domain n=1 Tax=Caloranaerobacter azorensis DSM 13643 TaxID=1121264 RepID=A0A1M5UEB7_9FIRM|nr:[Fe-Fe] hydrogenase large subunit C-terminal domain-containing protein [Caloranaerobacter azorensis]SHH61176.1 Iron only hydrogenase large subunit, C-terminal domain [Caloranaerobacter azorensis DSM 13643]